MKNKQKKQLKVYYFKKWFPDLQEYFESVFLANDEILDELIDSEYLFEDILFQPRMHEIHELEFNKLSTKKSIYFIINEPIDGYRIKKEIEINNDNPVLHINGYDIVDQREIKFKEEETVWEITFTPEELDKLGEFDND